MSSYQSESSLVRLRVAQVVRELAYALGDSIDHAGLLRIIIRGLHDTEETVLVSSVHALSNMFAETDETPEGLAEEHIGTMAPALITLLSSDNTEVRLLFQEAFPASHVSLRWVQQLRTSAMRTLGVLTRRAREAMAPFASELVDPLVGTLSDAQDENASRYAVPHLAWLWLVLLHRSWMRRSCTWRQRYTVLGADAWSS